jgi:hypothetical protein
MTIIYSIDSDICDNITLELERAASLACTLVSYGETFGIEEPWFPNFLISLAVVFDIVERARSEIIEHTFVDPAKKLNEATA